MATHVGSTFPSTPDDLLVKLAHLPLRLVPSLVAGEGQVGEHEVDRGEPAIEGFVSSRKRLVQLVPDLFTLQSGRCREDGQFGHAVERVGVFPFADDGLEFVVHEIGSLLFDEGDVGPKVFGRESEFDHSLLLHQHLVGTVVDDALAKDRGGQVLYRASVSAPCATESPTDLAVLTVYASSAET